MIRQQFLDYCQGLKKALDSIPTDAAEKFLQLLETAYLEGRQVFLMGNGGSGASASHAAGDLNKGVSYGREKRFRVISLNDNMATLTAYANDVSYADAFVEQLKNFLHPGDVVIGISGSGNSPNVLKAIEYANQQGAVTGGAVRLQWREAGGPGAIARAYSGERHAKGRGHSHDALPCGHASPVRAHGCSCRRASGRAC